MQLLRTDYGGRMTIDYFSQDDLRKILETIQRGESVNPQKRTETEMMGALTGATPLVPVDGPVLVEGGIRDALIDTPYTPVPTPDEEVFTKHDSLHEPETPPEVLDKEIEQEDEVMYSIKNFSL